MARLQVTALLLAFSACSLATTYFKEEFNDASWEDRWIQSEHKDKEFGKFKLTPGKFYGDATINQGIQTSQDARFYAVAAKFNKFSNEGKPLVIQFSVKHEQNIDCGGGYVKVFGSDLDPKDLHGESPYKVMFGPDICGPGTKKVHVIVNYKGTNHLIKKNIRCKDDEFTHVYTLVIKPDNSYVVKIDDKEEEKGTLEEDWDILPPKKIKDPEAKKPEQDEWDERETIPDETDTKPEDWDKPQHIPDPEAKKPEDWDEEMDGSWEAPNIENPDYKGEWKAKDIPNPAYKGKWIHPEIDNPEYKPDDKIYLFNDIGAIGLDLWQVKSGSIFDNVLITDDEDEASKHAQATWGATKDEEKKAKEKLDEDDRKKAEEESKKSGGDADEPKDDDNEADEEDKHDHDHDDHDHDHDEL